MTTLAGKAGARGSVDGTGAAARFSNPTGVAVDRADNLYVTDGSTVREVTPAGVVTKLAGTAGMYGTDDGTGAAAHFDSPTGAVADSAGNVYVADSHTIRKITPDGVTTTIAGSAGVIGIQLGATPRFAYPRRLAIVGDSIVVTAANAVLLLRHGAR